jgi:hypothetical protein
LKMSRQCAIVEMLIQKNTQNRQIYQWNGIKK